MPVCVFVRGALVVVFPREKESGSFFQGKKREIEIPGNSYLASTLSHMAAVMVFPQVPGQWRNELMKANVLWVWLGQVALERHVWSRVLLDSWICRVTLSP